MQRSDTENVLPSGRSLRHVRDDLYRDLSDQQYKRLENGRFHPVIPGHIKWSSSRGFDVARLHLECLGKAAHEFKFWNVATDTEMDRAAWGALKVKAVSKVPIKHSVCGTIVETTSIHAMRSSRSGVGCSHCLYREQNYDDFLALVPSGYELMLTREEWRERCDGQRFCPPIRCIQHDVLVLTTSVAMLKIGRGVGCPKCFIWRWRDHFHEFLTMVPSGYELMLTRDEWQERCYGKLFCPPIKCIEHGVIVLTTSIESLHKGNGVGCTSCINKTEGIVHDWLTRKYPWNVQRQFPGPRWKGQTRFDFAVFSGKKTVIVEVDGPQHFWEKSCRGDKFWEACRRDLFKENWALRNNMSVVRVLQEDAWFGRYDWRGWLARCIESAFASATPRIYFQADVPEYTSADSAYVALRGGGGGSNSAGRQPSSSPPQTTATKRTRTAAL